MRGFDRSEIAVFLEKDPRDYETTLRENERLRQQIVRLKVSINEFHELAVAV